MIFELLLILPIYIGVFVIFYRFKHVIKAMSEIEMFSEIIESSEINKREFLMDKVKSGEQISNSKTPWTEERLEKASDKVIENYMTSIKILHQLRLISKRPWNWEDLCVLRSLKCMRKGLELSLIKCLSLKTVM